MSELPHYRRQNQKGALYQLVYHLRDELPRAWESCFQETYVVLRDEVLDIFDE